MPQPLKATFFAFKERKPRGVLARTVAVHFVLSLALAATAFGAGFLALVLLGETLVAESLGVLAGLLVLFAIGVFGYFIALAFEASCLRWFIRGQRSGFLGFSFGADTWRVYSGHWMWVTLLVGGLIAPWLVATLVSAALSIAGQPINDATAPLALIATLSGVVISWVVLGLRFATGSAVSIAQQRFAYFQGARAAKGRFWALLGSFTTVWALVALIWIGLFIALGMGVFAIVGDSPENADTINFSMMVVLVVVTLAAQLVFTLLSAGVNARAVIAAIDEGKLEGVTVNVAEVFS